ncbi:MAG: hypothetical protein ACOXZK_02450 [Bacteroidales bacterium]|nr:hypothetical protein [Bacteroidales bacterium]
MKKSIFFFVFVFSMLSLFSQELKDATIRLPFSESSGKFLVVIPIIYLF